MVIPKHKKPNVCVNFRTEYMELRTVQTADSEGNPSNERIFQKVKYVADDSLKVGDFKILAVLRAGNMDALRPLMLPDNDRFNSINSISQIDSLAAAASKLVNEYNNSQSNG